MKRLISLALTLVLLVTALASCNNGKDKGNNTESETNAPVTTSPESLLPPADGKILMENLTKYIVIYPENDRTVQMAAVELIAAIEAKFGVLLTSKNDFVSDFSDDYKAGDFEIILGTGNRDEAKTFLKETSYKDYGWASYGRKLVIGGHTSDLTVKAVEDFANEIVLAIADGAEYFYTPENNKTVLADYHYGSMTVNGTSIAEYRIVIPSSSAENFEKAMAQKIQKSIAEYCGPVLDIVKDSEAASGKEILIGKTNRSATLTELNGITDGKGYLAVENGNIVICGNNALGNVTATQAFLATFEGGESAETVALSITNGLKDVARTNNTFNAMTFNVSNEAVNEARVTRVVETILKFMPDTVALQECTTQWQTKLEALLGDYYGIVGVPTNGTEGEANLMLFARDKFTIVETATKWISATPDTASTVSGASANYAYTYAILERNYDHTKIMHVSTQLDSSNATVRKAQADLLLEFLYAHKDYAIVFSGDLGCTTDSAEFALLTLEFMRNGADMATDADFGSLTKETLTDHFLAYDEYIDILSYVIHDEKVSGDYASDHRAAYIEYIVNYEGTDLIETETGNGLGIVPDRDGSSFAPIIPFP